MGADRVPFMDSFNHIPFYVKLKTHVVRCHIHTGVSKHCTSKSLMSLLHQTRINSHPQAV
jgi:hypothetical protein